VSLLYGLSSAKIAWQAIILSAIFLITFVAIEVYVASEPIIPVIVLKSRGVLLACIAQLGIMAARWMVLFYSPVYAISILSWSPSSAGSILIPTNIGFAMGGLLVGWLHIKRGGSFWMCVSPRIPLSGQMFTNFDRIELV
jgi:membrane-associated HD superfamily phosphohydrolase